MDSDTDIPASVDSPNSKLVSRYLATTGGASLDDAKRSLGLPLLTLLSVLERLREMGHVERDGGTYTAGYA